MATAENGKIDYEAGQTAVAMAEITDSGDQITYTTTATLFSGVSGSEADVRPNGLATGGASIPAISGTNNLIDVAALTCYLAGVLTTVSADTDVAIVRAATDVASISSITVNSSGAIAVVIGTDSADTNFSETRAAAGGPPLIPTTSIEIAQVRTTSNTAAAITTAQIFQVIGLHRERYDSPLFEPNNSAGTVVFNSAIPSIHTGTLPKKVYASYATPIFTEVSQGTDYVPSANSYSLSSTAIYGGTIGATSQTLGQGSFTAFLKDGITDQLAKLEGENLWFRFYPDKYKAPYLLDQGKLGVTISYPASDNISASCTINAETAATKVES
jgi:hypothetical protein